MDIETVKDLLDNNQFYKRLNTYEAGANFIRSFYEIIDTIYSTTNSRLNSLFRSIQLYRSYYEQNSLRILYDNIYFSSDINSTMDDDNKNKFYNSVLSDIFSSETDVISAEGYIDDPEIDTRNKTEVIGKWDNVFDFDIATPYTILGYGNGSLKVRIKIHKKDGFNKFFLVMMPRGSVRVWISDDYGIQLTNKVTDNGLVIFSLSGDADEFYLNIEDVSYFSHIISIFDIGFLNDDSGGISIEFDMDNIKFTMPNIIFNSFGGSASTYKLVNKNDESLVYLLEAGKVNILNKEFIKIGTIDLYRGGLFNSSLDLLQFSNKIKYIPFIWSGDDDSSNLAIYPLESLTITSDENFDVDIIGYKTYLSVSKGMQSAVLEGQVLYRISNINSFELSSDNYILFHYDNIYFIGVDYMNSILIDGEMVYLVGENSEIIVNRDYTNLKYFYTDLSDYNLLIESNTMDTYGGFYLAENVVGPGFATIIGMVSKNTIGYNRFLNKSRLLSEFIKGISNVNLPPLD